MNPSVPIVDKRSAKIAALQATNCELVADWSFSVKTFGVEVHNSEVYSTDL